MTSATSGLQSPSQPQSITAIDWYQIYCVVTRTRVWTTCPESLHCRAPTGCQTRDLLIARPMLNPLCYYTTVVVVLITNTVFLWRFIDTRRFTDRFVCLLVASLILRHVLCSVIVWREALCDANRGNLSPWTPLVMLHCRTMEGGMHWVSNTIMHLMKFITCGLWDVIFTKIDGFRRVVVPRHC